MEEVKDNIKLHIVTIEGYKTVVFTESTEKKVIDLLKHLKVDMAVLISKKNGHILLHFITVKPEVNPNIVVNRLVAEGKKNDLYSEYISNEEKSFTSAKVYAANTKLFNI